MLGSSYKVATIWGIPIKIHISLIILIVYFSVWRGTTSAFWGILAFASIALHELGHSYVAIKKGCRVREITLMFLGGAAQMEQIPSRPRDEILMALAGPAVSAVLGAMGIALGYAAAYRGWESVALTLFVVGGLNIVFVIFNLIPAFPMDGGRVLRALLTKRKGRLKATYIASRVGRVIAGGFILIGIFGIRSTPLFQPGDLRLIAVGIFVFMAAGREFRMVQIEEAMRRQNRATWGNGWAWGGGTSAPPPPQPTSDDDVIISPPPFENGPASHVEIEKEPRQRRAPFGWG